MFAVAEWSYTTTQTKIQWLKRQAFLFFLLCCCLAGGSAWCHSHLGATPGCGEGSDLLHMSHFGALLKGQQVRGHVLVIMIMKMLEIRPGMYTEGCTQVLPANTPSPPSLGSSTCQSHTPGWRKLPSLPWSLSHEATLRVAGRKTPDTWWIYLIWVFAFTNNFSHVRDLF